MLHTLSHQGRPTISLEERGAVWAHPTWPTRESFLPWHLQGFWIERGLPQNSYASVGRMRSGDSGLVQVPDSSTLDVRRKVGLAQHSPPWMQAYTLPHTLHLPYHHTLLCISIVIGRSFNGLHRPFAFTGCS